MKTRPFLLAFPLVAFAAEALAQTGLGRPFPRPQTGITAVYDIDQQSVRYFDPDNLRKWEAQHGTGWRVGGGIAGGGWHAGGVPGTGFPSPIGNPSSNANTYPWYNGQWHNHWQGNGFGGSGGGNNPPRGWGAANQAYSNPYNMAGVAGPYNYGQPVPFPTGAKLADVGNPDVALAIDKFRAGDYAKARAIIDGVIRIQPYDAAAHELRALILFAIKDYPAAAATIHSVLATGPGWDWTTLSSVYSDMQIYQSQLATLEKYVADHSSKADALFLLAYHYITAGHIDAAKAQLEQVVALVPHDKLSAKLLQTAGTGAAAAQPAVAAAQPAAVPPPAAAAEVKPVDPAAVIGQWHAKGDDGATFELELTPGKTFTWKTTKKGQARTITGTYTLDQATLTLHDGNGGGDMAAQVSIEGGNRFTFKPQAGPPNDPSLTFIK